MKIYSFILVSLIMTGYLFGAENQPSKSTPSPVKIIFDTDIGGDIDDLGSLAILHGMADKGECEILATISCTGRQKAVNAISAVNIYFGRPDVPVGRCDTEVSNWGYAYCEYIAENFKHNLDGKDAPKSTELYRKILSSQPDSSVVIVSVGGLLNIRNLLNSPADKYSELNGKDLIAKKVNKMVVMGGQYPSSGNNPETNFKYCGEGVSQFVVENFPRHQTFSGSEIGVKNYRTGSKLNDLPDSSPIKAGYLYFMKNPPKWAGAPRERIENWQTYDQCALIVAVRGIEPYFTEITGSNKVTDEGTNEWQETPVKDQGYIAPKMDPQTFASTIIEPLMMSLPR